VPFGIVVDALLDFSVELFDLFFVSPHDAGDLPADERTAGKFSLMPQRGDFLQQLASPSRHFQQFDLFRSRCLLGFKPAFDGEHREDFRIDFVRLGEDVATFGEVPHRPRIRAKERKLGPGEVEHQFPLITACGLENHQRRLEFLQRCHELFSPGT
jgi:hypothetical protein